MGYDNLGQASGGYDSILESMGIGDTPEETPYVSDDRAWYRDMLAGAGRGITNLVGLGAEAAEAVGIDNSVDEWAAALPENTDWLKRSKSDYLGEGNMFTNSARGFTETMTQSLAAAAPAAGAGFAVAGPVGAGVGGLMSMFTLYAMGGGHQKYEEALEAGKTKEEATSYGIKSGLTDFGLESAGAAMDFATAGIGGKLLKGAFKAGSKASAKSMARAFVSESGKQSLKTMAEVQASEGLTEQAQLFAQEKFDRDYEMGGEFSMKNHLETAITTAGMSLVFGGVAVKYNRAKKRNMQKALESGDRGQMSMAANAIKEDLTAAGDTDLANSWEQYTNYYIKQGTPVDLDGNYVLLADKIENTSSATIEDLTSSNEIARNSAEEKAFNSIGLNPDGSTMDPADFKELQDKAVDSFTARAINSPKEKPVTAAQIKEDSKLKPTPVKKPTGTSMKEEVDKTAALFQKEDKIAQEELAARKKEEAEAKHLADNVSEFKENTKVKKEKALYRREKLQAVAVAEAAQEQTRMAQKKADEVTAKIESARTKAVDEAAIEDARRGVVKEADQKIKTKAEATIQAKKDAKVGKANALLASERTAAVEDTKGKPPRAYMENKFKSAYRVAEFLGRREEVDTIVQGGAVSEEQVMERMADDKIRVKLETAQALADRGKTEMADKMTQEAISAVSIFTDMGFKDIAQKAIPAPKVEEKPKAVVKKLPTLTVDQALKADEELAQEKANPITESSGVDLKDWKTKDPVVKSWISSDTKGIKERLGAKGGHVKASEIDSEYKSVRDRLVQEEAPVSILEQLDYAFDGIRKEVMARKEAKTKVEWDKGNRGYAEGITDTGGRVAITKTPDGEFQLISREKGGEWVIDPKAYKSLEAAKESVDPTQVETKDTFIKRSGKDGKVAERVTDDNGSYYVYDGTGAVSNWEIWVGGKPRRVTLRDKKGNQVGIKYRKLVEAKNKARELEGLEVKEDEAKPKQEKRVLQKEEKKVVVRRRKKADKPDNAETNDRAGALKEVFSKRKGHSKYKSGSVLMDMVSAVGKKGDPWISPLAKILTRLGKKQLGDVRVYTIPGKGAFYYKGDVYFGEGLNLEENADVVLHELSHALTAKAINEGSAMRAEIQGLMSIMGEKMLGAKAWQDFSSRVKTSQDYMNLSPAEKADFKKKWDGVYSLSNPKEFLSSLFNDRKFREELDATKAPEKGKTLYNKFVDILKKIFGIKTQEGNMLERMLEITEEAVGKNSQSPETMELSAWDTDEMVARTKKLIKTSQQNIENLMKPLTEALAAIDKGLVPMFRKMEFLINRKQMAAANDVKEWVSGIKKLRKNATAYKELSMALLNYNTDPGRVRKIMESHGLGDAFKKVEDRLKIIKKEYDSAGLGVFNEMDFYFPRRVNDYKGLRDLLEKRKGKGTISVIQENDKLTNEQKTEMISQIVNTGYFPELALKRPAGSKERTIVKVNDKMSEFYMRPEDALITHMSESIERIETRKLIQPSGLVAAQRKYKQLLKSVAKEKNPAILHEKQRELAAMEQKFDSLINADSSAISAYLQKSGKSYTVAEEEKIVELMRARLNQKGMTGPLNTVKNLGLITALGSPLSAMTQVGDMVWSLHKNGFAPTLTAVFGKKEITQDDLEFTSAIKEFQTSGTTEAVSWVLEKTGFTAMDSFMKRTSMQASLNRFKRMDKKDFVSEWRHVFGTAYQTEKVYEDIKAGNKTEDVMYTVFTDVSRFQPISLSEMPATYLTAGNGRILYTLKSYSIKAFANLMREATNPDVDVKQRIKTTTRLVTLLVLANASLDTLKDLLMGDDIDFSDAVMDNLMKLFFMSRYSLDKVSQGGPSVLWEEILNPVAGKVVDDAFRDSKNLLFSEDKTYRTLRNIPVLGRVVYDRATPEGQIRMLDKRRRKLNKKVREWKDNRRKGLPRAEIRKFNKEARKMGEAEIKY